MKTVYNVISACLVSITILNAQVVPSNFDALTLAPDSYWNGSDGTSPGGFNSGSAFFPNDYNTGWGYWLGGFAYSNSTDNTTAGYTNYFSAITGKDYSGNGNYAVGQANAVIKLTGDAIHTTVTGFYLTNSTYAALSMQNGDSFAKKFGGSSGDDPDYFKLLITGYSGGNLTSTTVEAYLADFRNSDNRFDYILTHWKWVDLRPLGNVDSLLFTMESSDMSGGYLNTPSYFVIDEFNAPLFSPLGGQSGSTAVSKNDASIVNWAQTCTVTRGPQNIASPASPLASYGVDDNAVGAATGTTLVSLGDGGSAVLTFEHPITDGEGADFAVFENGFTNGSLLFAELAFVEVSSDGVNFFRFPAISNTPADVQNNSIYIDPQLLYNLAGSAQANYGTAFDLSELSGTEGLDIHRVTHVRIVDVVGSIDPDYAREDKNGNVVNDPWPTDFASSGFDLDAVAVLHEDAITGIFSMHDRSALQVYPNPVATSLYIKSEISFDHAMLEILDMTGRSLKEEQLESGANQWSCDVSSLKPGMYMVKVNGQITQFIKQ